jgi:hypothetical protein
MIMCVDVTKLDELSSVNYVQSRIIDCVFLRIERTIGVALAERGASAHGQYRRPACWLKLRVQDAALRMSRPGLRLNDAEPWYLHEVGNVAGPDHCTVSQSNRRDPRVVF